LLSFGESSLTSLDPQSRVVRSIEPLSAETGDGFVMISLEQGKYFGLNETALAIWRVIETPTTVGAICGTIESEFDVAHDVAAASVTEFVSKLIEEGIATVEP
jgi:hypothetical protein